MRIPETGHGEDAMHERIREGLDVFLHNGEKSFGAVRQVR
jgi:hypothetical protein